MNIIATLNPEEIITFNSYIEEVFFPKGTCIVKAGDPGNGCYYIDEGVVVVELASTETDSESVLGHVDAGSFLGELSLFDGMPRSASAYAETDVKARWLEQEQYEKLCREHPQIGMVVTRALAGNLCGKLRQTDIRLAEYLFGDDVDAATNAMVARASAAVKAFAAWPEEKVDALVNEVAQAIAAQAEPLAAATVEETKIGVVADKVLKNRFAALRVAATLVGKPASGIVGQDADNKIVEIAAPAGVVVGLIPVTNPVATMVFKALICIKSRCALICSCSRNAMGVGVQAGTIIRETLLRLGAPVDLVQWIQGRASRRTTAMFMKHPDVRLILATGGPSMVRAAYSSGTPAIGVGAGNAPCWVAPDADIEAAAECIIRSKTFDCGVICGSENNLVVDSSIMKDFVAAMEKLGAAVLTMDEKHRFTARIFNAPGGHLSKDVVGRPAAETASLAGIKRPYPIRLILIPVSHAEVTTPFALEKLAPILSLFTTTGEADAMNLCKTILQRDGIGHTAIVHSKSEDTAKRYGVAIPASRILVNSPGAHGCVGITTGLTPSLTLGCGYLGHNSTTDNVTYRHLLNVKRVAWLFTQPF